jgi:hypothetical protein
MKYFKITSKRTGRVEVIDEDIKLSMSNDLLKKFYIEDMPEAVKIIPEEIIKRKVTKQEHND